MKLTAWCLLAIAAAMVVMLATVWLASPLTILAQEKTADEDKIAGTWRGVSLCVDKTDACHDETAVYRIATIPGKRDALLVSGGKMVDGKDIVMGKGEWAYDRAKSTLSMELPRGVITLKLDGEMLNGSYVLPDKSVLRKISLKKVD
jgi:hypothetical protein